MALVRTNDHEAPRTLSEVMDQLFSERNLINGTGFRPDMDLYETKSSYEVEVMLPGLRKSDIDLEVTGQSLRISGRREQEGDKDVTYHLREGSSGYFERMIEIPEDGNLEEIEARFENGILFVTIQKHEKNSGKQIGIQ